MKYIINSKKKMALNFAVLAMLVFFASCSSNKTLKLTSSIKGEFLNDSSGTRSRYVNSEIEAVGFFEYDEKNGNWSFNILDSNIHNQEDDSTDENTAVSDFANKIHSMRLGINTDLSKNKVDSQNIVSPLKVSGGYWIYDKSKDKFYSPETWGTNIDALIQILSKEGGVYNNVVIDSYYIYGNTVQYRNGDVKINDTTLDMLDNHLKYWSKDISAIQHNNIYYLPLGKYQKMKIIDIVTIKGKVSDIVRRTGNYEVVGTIDVLVVNLKNVEILKKERVDTKNFVLLDYAAKQKMIHDGIKSAPQKDTTAIKQDTTKKS